jgi:hypothetical protein
MKKVKDAEHEKLAEVLALWIGQLVLKMVLQHPLVVKVVCS